MAAHSQRKWFSTNWHQLPYRQNPTSCYWRMACAAKSEFLTQSASWIRLRLTCGNIGFDWNASPPGCWRPIRCTVPSLINFWAWIHGRCWNRSLVTQGDDHLDLVWLRLERVAGPLERHPPGDQAIEPIQIGSNQGRGGEIVVVQISVDRSDDHIVVQHQFAVERPAVEGDCFAGRGHPGEADDAVGRGGAYRVEYHRGHAGGVDDHVGLSTPSGLGDALMVVSGAQRAHQVGLGAGGHDVEHMHVQPSLHPE